MPLVLSDAAPPLSKDPRVTGDLIALMNALGSTIINGVRISISKVDVGNVVWISFLEQVLAHAPCSTALHQPHARRRIFLWLDAFRRN